MLIIHETEIKEVITISDVITPAKLDSAAKCNESVVIIKHCLYQKEPHTVVGYRLKKKKARYGYFITRGKEKIHEFPRSSPTIKYLYRKLQEDKLI